MRYIFLILLCSFPLFLLAQDKEVSSITNLNLYEDVVYLKNGSIIRGELMEVVMGEYVRIKILGGSQFVYETDDIEKIQKEKKDFTKIPGLRVRRPRHIPEFNGGIYHKITSHFMPGQGTNGWPVVGISLHYAAGYKFNQYANVGVGVGIETFSPEQFVPVYVDFRGYTGKNSASFFYGMQVGYGIGKIAPNNWIAVTEAKGGIMIKPEIGVRLPSRGKTHFTFGLGFRMQKGEFTIEERFWDQFGNENMITRINTVTLQRFTFQWGVLF